MIGRHAPYAAVVAVAIANMAAHPGVGAFRDVSAYPLYELIDSWWPSHYATRLTRSHLHEIYIVFALFGRI